MAHANPDQELEQRNRLPTLMEVLGRRTLAPVDLFSFYIYMRDQQRSVDYLDFWSAQPSHERVATILIHSQARCVPAHVPLSTLCPRTATVNAGRHSRDGEGDE